MRKKLFILFSVFLILGSCVLPAFADGVGSGTVVYSVLPFDTIQFGSNFGAWVGSSSRVGSDLIETNDIYGYSLIASAETSVLYRIDTEIYAPSKVATFSSDMLIVSVPMLTVSNAYQLYFGVEDELNGTVSYSGTIVGFNDVGDNWVLSSQQFSNVLGKRPDDGFDLGNALAATLSIYTDKRYVMIKDFTVTLEITDEIPSGSNVVFDVVSLALPTTPPNLSVWKMQYPLASNTTVVVDPANPADVSFTDWLTVAVGSFLNFELWPSFSINQVLYLVLVIGVLLAFFTMLI